MSIDKSHAESPKTDDVIVDDEGSVVKFNNKFACLGSVINFALNGTVDVESRVPKARKSMGALHFIWEDDSAPLMIKAKSCDVVQLSLLLWGGENWSRNAADISKCEVLHHEATRRILKMSMAKVKDGRTRSKTTRNFFSNEPSIEDAWRRRQSFFIGRASRMKNSMCVKTSSSETVDGE